MQDTLIKLLLDLLPGVIVGVFMAYFSRTQKKRERQVDARADARRKESLLGLEMQMATAKMAYSAAVAVKRGHINGEIEEGIEAYEGAKKKYFEFLNEQAAHHLM